MNQIQKKRLSLIIFFAIVATIVIALILYALKQNLNAFVTPKQLNHTAIKENVYFRLGGMVKPNSVKRIDNGLEIEFVITDFKNEVTARYTGILPDLFQEGKGVIGYGHLNAKGEFMAKEVLAKHNENYMPKHVAKAMKADA